MITHYVNFGRVGFPARLSGDGRSALAAVTGPWVREGQVIATQQSPGRWVDRISGLGVRADVREVRRRPGPVIGDRSRRVQTVRSVNQVVQLVDVWVPEANDWTWDETRYISDFAPCWAHGNCEERGRDGARAPRRGRSRQ